MIMKTKRKKAQAAMGRKKIGKKKYTVDDLLKIMARLRSPSGCPWDREQTANSLKKYLIEESYEVLEAIESGTPGELREELADLLLQIVFISRIAEEKGDFNFPGIVNELAEKLVRRHPHVFPQPDRPRPTPKNAGEVLKVWGSVKEMEGKYAKRNSLLDGIPLALPALERARRMSERVSRVGFDWPHIRRGLEKSPGRIGGAETGGKRDFPEGGGRRTRRPSLHPGELGPFPGNFGGRGAAQGQPAFCPEVLSGGGRAAQEGETTPGFDPGRDG